MRSTYTKISVLAALALTLSVGVPVSAQTAEVSADASVSVTGSAGINVPSAPRLGDRPLPKDPRAKENIQQNRDLRNKMVEERKEGIKEVRVGAQAELRDMREDRREEMKNATNTSERKIVIEKFKDAKGELLKKARKDEVTVRQSTIVEGLRFKIKTLKAIAARAEEFLKKHEEQGHSTTEARLKLDTAIKKISTAEVAVEAFATWKPSETGTASSTEVALEKPRQAAASAIAAIKDAGEALRAVIVSITPRLEVKTSVQTNN